MCFCHPVKFLKITHLAWSSGTSKNRNMSPLKTTVKIQTWPGKKGRRNKKAASARPVKKSWGSWDVQKIGWLLKSWVVRIFTENKCALFLNVAPIPFVETTICKRYWSLIRSHFLTIADVLWMFDNSLLNLSILDVSMTKLWSPNQKKWPVIQIIYLDQSGWHEPCSVNVWASLKFETRYTKGTELWRSSTYHPKQRTPRNKALLRAY